MTLNQEAALIANNLNQPFNQELKERIKDIYKQQMALYIRRSIKEHGIDDGLVVSYTAELIKVGKYNKPIFNEEGDYILRTKYPVPTPVRYPGDSPFIYVGTDDGLLSFPMRNPMETQVMHLYLFSGRSNSYRLSNGYIYINDNPNFKPKLKYLKVEGIFESPEEVLGIYENTDGQDINLPFPADISAMIQGQVMQIVAALPPDDISVKQSDNKTVVKE